MHHKLSVIVQVDLDGKTVRILATGCLTEASQRGLHSLIRRARTLTPGVRVTVDCTGARHVEAPGVELLRRTIEHDGNTVRLRPVDFLLPDPLPGPASPAQNVQPAKVAGVRGDIPSPANSPKVVSVPAPS